MTPEAGSRTRTRALPGYAACAAAGLLWGTGFYFGKIALAEMPVGPMVLYRFLFACLGVLPFALRQRARLNRREWRTLLLASFLGVPVQFLVQFYGLSLTSLSHAALMVGTLPVFLAVGACLFARERLDAPGWAALCASSAGVMMIVLGGRHGRQPGGPSLGGDLLVILSLAINLIWVLMNKRLLARHPALVITAYGLLSGTLMLAPMVLAWTGLPPLHGVSLRAWLALAASGLLCTACTTFFWNWGIHRVPASRAGVFLNLEPAVGSWLGVRLMGDRLGPYAWLGAALILVAAIVLTSRGGESVPETLLEA